MGQTEQPLKRLGAALAAAQAAELEALAPPRGVERLLATFERRARRRKLAASALGVGFAAALGWALSVHERALTFEVGTGGSGRTEARVGARMEALPLRFSDGTELTLAPEAQARVVELHEMGARVVLEQGALSAAVVHRAATRWTVVAGPFEIWVTGTRFDMSWAPASESLALALREGSVRVTGPSLGAGRVLQRGDALRVTLRAPEPAPAPSTPAPSAVAPAAPVALAPEPAPAPTQPARLRSRRSAASNQAAPEALSREKTSASRAAASDEIANTWQTLRQLANAGRYSEALLLARASELSALCERATPEDLVLLADAARLSADASLARQLLLALRERFALDRRAATAAFLLGRIAFEGADYADASRWFSFYFDEHPAGALAGDALLRLAETRAQLGDGEGARHAARRYLEAYPGGPLRERARRLAE